MAKYKKAELKKVFKPILRELLYEQHEVVNNLVKESLEEMIREEGLIKEMIMEEVFKSSGFSDLISEVTKGVIDSHKMLTEASGRNPQTSQAPPQQSHQRSPEQSQQVSEGGNRQKGEQAVEKYHREFKSQFENEQKQKNQQLLSEKIGGVDVFDGTKPIDSAGDPNTGGGNASQGSSLAAMRQKAGKGGSEMEVPDRAVDKLTEAFGGKWKQLADG